MGDGRAEVMLANHLVNSVSVFRNMTSAPGNIQMGTSTEFTVGSEPFTISVGDIDGDSKVDLAVVNYVSASFSILRNTSGGVGSIAFAPTVDFPVSADPHPHAGRAGRF